MTHGGKRQGAGRKPGARALITRSKAEAILATVDEEEVWGRLLQSRNDRIVLNTMRYLTDRRDGKAVQAIQSHVDLSASVALAERIEAARKRVSESEQ